MSDLTENSALDSQQRLDQLLEQARRNQMIMQRHQAFDLQFISAGGFQALIQCIFDTLAAPSELELVTLALIDPVYEIRRIMADLNLTHTDYPHLLFFQSTADAGDVSVLRRPALGKFIPERHRKVVPESLPQPHSVAIVPLIRHDRVIGYLTLGSEDPQRFAPNMATDFIEHMASIVSICLENVINIEKLKHLGLTDPLTGVHNRRFLDLRLQEELGRARRNGNALSCMFIDIDHFKHINDQVGHQGGDQVLRDVASRIKRELRLTDALGRFGGEEFVVLLCDAGAKSAMHVAERIRAGIASEPILITPARRVEVSVSIGVSVLTDYERSEPGDSTGDKLIARADLALYQAKDKGRNRVALAELVE